MGIIDKSKPRKRPKGMLAMGWACFECAYTGRTEHAPTSADYPDTVIKRTTFTAGGGHGWTISALVTPRARPAPWKIVVITGAPSWAEYWAPTMAGLDHDREMIVVDRPGYAASEPHNCVPDIRAQAEALGPLLKAAPGQKVLLVGQSYGAAIATLMAAAQPFRVSSLVLLSGYFSEAGPTARWLLDVGSKFSTVIPRDLRHAVIEVNGQPRQLPLAKAALKRLRMPVHVIHGDKDDFAPIEVAERLAKDARPGRAIRFHRVSGANHFLNDGPAETLLSALEASIPDAPKPALPWLWPTLVGVADALAGAATAALTPKPAPVMATVRRRSPRSPARDR